MPYIKGEFFTENEIEMAMGGMDAASRKALRAAVEVAPKMRVASLPVGLIAALAGVVFMSGMFFASSSIQDRCAFARIAGAFYCLVSFIWYGSKLGKGDLLALPKMCCSMLLGILIFHIPSVALYFSH